MRSIALSLALAAPMLSTDALACGGFFCQTTPIDQSAEKIVFAVDEAEGTVETHVQIAYTGAAQEFSWIVPVPSVPELALSSDTLFTVLEWTTAPQFWLNYEERGTCEYDTWFGGGGVLENSAADGAGGGAPSAGGGVEVIAEQQVGPYDSVVLAATDSAELLQWLGDNGYTIPSNVAPSLQPYLAGGSYFIALKLQNDADAGDIAPIKFTYQATAPMIPLVLTRIAATPDMRVQPYVFSSARAVPDNYLHVQINEAAVNWLSGGSNYNDVVTQAANEAGGKAFATDYAGTTSMLEGMFYGPGRFDIDALAATDDPALFVQFMLNMGFPRGAAVQNLIRAYIPMPQELIDQGVDESSFYNCLECYREYLAGIEFDPVAFAAALDEAIVQPLVEVQAMVDAHDKLTRMTSSMSAEEMDQDAYFVLNSDMDDVSNQHQAQHVIDCGTGGKLSESPRWIELASGEVILLPPIGTDGSGGMMWPEDLGGTAASVIEDASASGQPTPVSDNGEVIADGLETHNADIREDYEAGGTELPGDLDGVGTGEVASCGGCDGTGGASAGWMAAFGLLAMRRRRT
ncbi:MAG: hypothetical protein RLZZ383_2481 [Pseudomonadota bacterium]|jgi:hypothetical protein